MTDITERLRELSKARWDKDAWERETTVRIPAEPDRDIDLVLANAAAEIDRLRARVAELEAELADDDALRESMADKLNRIAIAFRGEPPTLTSWGWEDLPERAAAAITAIGILERALHRLADLRELVPMLVDRFLGWKLPKDFAPDGGITFTPPHPNYDQALHWPTGTCLLNAPQATAMFEHLLGIDPPLQDGVELIDGCDCTCSVVQAAHGHHAGCPAKDTTP